MCLNKLGCDWKNVHLPQASKLKYQRYSRRIIGYTKANDETAWSMISMWLSFQSAAWHSTSRNIVSSTHVPACLVGSCQLDKCGTCSPSWSHVYAKRSTAMSQVEPSKTKMQTACITALPIHSSVWCRTLVSSGLQYRLLFTLTTDRPKKTFNAKMRNFTKLWLKTCSPLLSSLNLICSVLVLLQLYQDRRLDDALVQELLVVVRRWSPVVCDRSTDQLISDCQLRMIE